MVHRSIKKKKTVLCEKPATLASEENEEIIRIAKKNNTFFMEAMKTRFIPLISEIKEVIEKNIIGDIL